MKAVIQFINALEIVLVQENKQNIAVKIKINYSGNGKLRGKWT
jgi:hypothetical protein